MKNTPFYQGPQTFLNYKEIDKDFLFSYRWKTTNDVKILDASLQLMKFFYNTSDNKAWLQLFLSKTVAYAGKYMIIRVYSKDYKKLLFKAMSNPSDGCYLNLNGGKFYYTMNPASWKWLCVDFDELSKQDKDKLIFGVVIYLTDNDELFYLKEN